VRARFAWARRCATATEKSVLDDQDRRLRQINRGRADQRIAEAPSNRSCRCSEFHEVIRDSDPDRTFASGGAIEAALEARKAEKTRYIGFTGHKSPDIHLKMLATAKTYDFTFDTVQMPLNVMDASIRK
jgi:hypothetical protein